MSYEPFELAGRMLTAVRVMIDHPIEGCVASQIAGWRLESPGKEHAAILAGPGRALNKASLDHYFEWTDYRDDHHESVVAVQASEPIRAEMAEMIASSCEVAPEDLYILYAPNRSLVCAVQVAARIVEQTLHRLAEEGMDLRCLRSAYGFGVVPPLVNDDLLAVDVIDQVGIGGEFLSHDYTLEHFRRTIWLPKLWDHTNPDTLAIEKQSDMLDAARDKVRQIWDRDDLYQIDDDRARAIDDVVARAERALK